MAWEWVGPVSVAATGIAGVLGTWRVSKNSNDVQVRLLKEEHSHQLTAQTRQERKDTFAAFLTFVHQTHDLLLAVSVDVYGPWQKGAERAGWTEGMEHGSGFIPDAVLEAMEPGDAERAMEGVTRLTAFYPTVDRHVNEVRLCGSDRVIAAVDAFRKDFYDATELLRIGQFRTVEKRVMRELLDAFRLDLGYAESGSSPAAGDVRASGRP